VIRAKKRNELADYLKSKGIDTAIHYPTPLPLLPAYSYLQAKGSEYPVSVEYQSQILSLPMYPELSEEAIKYVCSAIKEFYSK
jgi:dTDP-4-amino-4,6-dideoxygalactose transaminase